MLLSKSLFPPLAALCFFHHRLLVVLKGCDFMWFSFSCLWFIKNSWTCGLMSFINFIRFSVIIFKYIACFIFSFLSETPIYYVRSCYIFYLLISLLHFHCFVFLCHIRVFSSNLCLFTSSLLSYSLFYYQIYPSRL